MRNVNEYVEEPRELRLNHLDLSTPCLEIGGNSTTFKGLLAHYLGTTIPSGRKIHLCHACNNGGCSNPTHLYWGTSMDNYIDRVEAGTQQASWNRTPTEQKEHGSWLGKTHGGSNRLKDEDLDRYKSVFDSLEKKRGWKSEAAKILNVSHSHVRRIEQRIMHPSSRS